jgi:hypothetical protein
MASRAPVKGVLRPTSEGGAPGRASEPGGAWRAGGGGVAGEHRVGGCGRRWGNLRLYFAMRSERSINSRLPL